MSGVLKSGARCASAGPSGGGERRANETRLSALFGAKGGVRGAHRIQSLGCTLWPWLVWRAAKGASPTGHDDQRRARLRSVSDALFALLLPSLLPPCPPTRALLPARRHHHRCVIHPCCARARRVRVCMQPSTTVKMPREPKVKASEAAGATKTKKAKKDKDAPKRPLR